VALKARLRAHTLTAVRLPLSIVAPSAGLNMPTVKPTSRRKISLQDQPSMSGSKRESFNAAVLCPKPSK
jgi:hypothetical protein